MSAQRKSTSTRPAKTAGKGAASQAGMSANTKATLGLVAAVVLVLGVIVAVTQFGEDETPKTSAQVQQTLVREDSHKLQTAADGKVTMVEFLDFECESCGAAYPTVEKLRAEYKDKITYVVRYFPIQSHPNALNAAKAAEAAARQGKFEAMYLQLFDNQTTWGHKQEPQTALFEDYAKKIGLDVDKFRADVADPATEKRIVTDAEDGQAAGVDSTPTFFINGEKFTGEYSYAGLKGAIDTALTK